MNKSNYPLLSLYLKSLKYLDRYHIKLIVGNDFKLNRRTLDNISSIDELKNNLWNGILFNISSPEVIDNYKSILSKPIINNVAYVDFTGFKLPSLNPKCYSNENPKGELFELKISYREKYLYEVIINNFRYEVDFINRVYLPVSLNKQRSNFKKLYLRKALRDKVGDAEDILADHSLLIQLLMNKVLGYNFKIDEDKLNNLLRRFEYIEYTKELMKDE